MTDYLLTKSDPLAPDPQLGELVSYLAPGAPGTSLFASGLLQTGSIADGAITSTKIADGTIQTVDLANGAVTSEKIADGTIQTVDIANGAVTAGKLAEDYVNVSGDTMTGALELSGDPTLPLQAATKQYVDAAVAALPTQGEVDAAILTSTPVGTIRLWPADVPPAGNLVCDGALYPKTTFPELAAVLGNRFGGDATTFAVPDLRGRVAVGRGANAAVATIGSSDGSVDVDRKPRFAIPNHTHGMDHTHAVGDHQHIGGGHFHSIIFGNLVNYAQLVVGPATVGRGVASGTGTSVSDNTHRHDIRLDQGTGNPPSSPQGAVATTGMTAATNTGAVQKSGGAVTDPGGASAGDVGPAFMVLNFIIRAE